MNIQVIAEPAAVRSGRTREVKKGQAYRDRPGAQAYMASLLWVATGLGVGLGLRTFLAVSNIALVFLPAILAVAIGYGLFPSLLACLLGVLAFNFFFLPPLYTFTIADPENVVALFFFGWSLPLRAISRHARATRPSPLGKGRGRRRSSTCSAASLLALSRLMTCLGDRASDRTDA